jgi:hypothetical protein
MGFLRDLFSRNQPKQPEETASLPEGVFINEETGFATVRADGYAKGSSSLEALCYSMRISLEEAAESLKDAREERIAAEEKKDSRREIAIARNVEATMEERCERLGRLKQVMIDAGYDIDVPEAATPEQPAP